MRKRRVFTTLKLLPGVTNRRNRPRTQNPCASPRKRPVLTTRSNRVSWVHKPSKSPRNPNTMCYSPRIMPQYAKTTSFHDALKSLPGVTNRLNRPETQKQCSIAHENGQNMRKRRVVTTHSNRVPGVINRRNRPGT
jgi:hypothetical protein